MDNMWNYRKAVRSDFGKLIGTIRYYCSLLQYNITICLHFFQTRIFEFYVYVIFFIFTKYEDFTLNLVDILRHINVFYNVDIFFISSLKNA